MGNVCVHACMYGMERGVVSRIGSIGRRVEVEWSKRR